MASEAVASPMRIATAPGRLARPAPPGNNDPCGERRTIPEGLPRLPREALMMRLQTGGSDVGRRASRGRQRTTASTGPGQKSHVERRKGERASRLVRRTSRRKSGFAARFAHIDRGHGLPVVRNERKAGLLLGLADRWGVRRPVMACRSGCVASIQAPPALRMPLAKGQRKRGKGREKGERKVEGSRESEEM